MLTNLIGSGFRKEVLLLTQIFFTSFEPVEVFLVLIWFVILGHNYADFSTSSFWTYLFHLGILLLQY